MATNKEPIFGNAVLGDGVTFTSADTTVKKDVIAAASIPADGLLLEDVVVCTDDTAAVNLAFYLHNGSASLYIGNVNIPIGSGYTTVALVEALRTLKPDLGLMTIKSGQKLEANCVATMTAAKTTTITWQGKSYVA